MLHEIITGIVACLWSLGYFNHISAKLVHVRTHCFSQPSLNDTLRITLKAQHSRAVGFRMLFLFSPVPAMAFHKWLFHINLLCRTPKNTADLHLPHRCVHLWHPKYRTSGLFGHWSTWRAEEEDDITIGSVHQLRSGEDRLGTNCYITFIYSLFQKFYFGHMMHGQDLPQTLTGLLCGPEEHRVLVQCAMQGQV